MVIGRWLHSSSSWRARDSSGGRFLCNVRLFDFVLWRQVQGCFIINQQCGLDTGNNCYTGGVISGFGKLNTYIHKYITWKEPKTTHHGAKGKCFVLPSNNEQHFKMWTKSPSTWKETPFSQLSFQNISVCAGSCWCFSHKQSCVFTAAGTAVLARILWHKAVLWHPTPTVFRKVLLTAPKACPEVGFSAEPWNSE